MAITAEGRYRITVTVADRAGGETATACAPDAASGRSALPVRVTVANADNRQAVPFPALRVELLAAGDRSPVPVRDSSGTCSFTPHEAAIDAGASVVLPGSTPMIDVTAPAGSLGRVEVAISENAFTLGVAVP